jgi:hypothetical protein
MRKLFTLLALVLVTLTCGAVLADDGCVTPTNSVSIVFSSPPKVVYVDVFAAAGVVYSISQTRACALPLVPIRAAGNGTWQSYKVQGCPVYIVQAKKPTDVLCAVGYTDSR